MHKVKDTQKYRRVKLLPPSHAELLTQMTGSTRCVEHNVEKKTNINCAHFGTLPPSRPAASRGATCLVTAAFTVCSHRNELCLYAWPPQWSCHANVPTQPCPLAASNVPMLRIFISFTLPSFTQTFQHGHSAGIYVVFLIGLTVKCTH